MRAPFCPEGFLRWKCPVSDVAGVSPPAIPVPVFSRTEALLAAACGAYHRSGCDSRDGDLFAGLPSLFKLAFKVRDLRLALRTGAGAVALVGAFGDDVVDAVCVGDLFADLFQDPAALFAFHFFKPPCGRTICHIGRMIREKVPCESYFVLFFILSQYAIAACSVLFSA